MSEGFVIFLAFLTFFPAGATDEDISGELNDITSSVTMLLLALSIMLLTILMMFVSSDFSDDEEDVPIPQKENGKSCS